MSSTFNGTIDVTIADAQLNISQHASKQDPYCVVTLGSSGVKRFMEGETMGKEKFQTKVQNNAGQHPMWNETHSMSLKNMNLDSHLKIKVWDKDVMKDDSMAIAKINLSQLLTNDKKGVQYYPLYKKSKLGQPTSGQIGQIGVGVAFNCTEIPQFQGDLKTQSSDAMHRKQQGLTSGVPGHYQSAQPMGTTTGAMTGPTTFPQQTGTTFPQQTGTTFPQQTGTFPQQTGTTFPQQTGTIFPQQTGTTFPQQTGTTGVVNPGLQKPMAQGSFPQTQGQYGQHQGHHYL